LASQQIYILKRALLENASAASETFCNFSYFLSVFRFFFFVAGQEIPKEIKSRLNSSSACYHSVQNLPSSRLLSEIVKIKTYKTIILPVVLYGCKTWSLTLRGEHRLRGFEKTLLRRMFGPKRDEITGDWTTLHNEELHTLRQT
jgi:hypothetical protein